MAITKKNNLNRFLNKLSAYDKDINSDIMAEKIAGVGKSQLDSLYGNTEEEIHITTGIENNGIGRRSISAFGERVPFIEFGTGTEGKGSYDGDLPTQTLTFESPQGVQQSTQGWQYNYRKEQGQTQKDWKGVSAGAQMFKTMKYLDENKVKIVREEWKGD